MSDKLISNNRFMPEASSTATQEQPANTTKDLRARGLEVVVSRPPSPLDSDFYDGIDRVGDKNSKQLNEALRSDSEGLINKDIMDDGRTSEREVKKEDIPSIEMVVPWHIKVPVDNEMQIEAVALPVLQQIALEAEKIEMLGDSASSEQKKSLTRYNSVVSRALGNEPSNNQYFKPWAKEEEINARVALEYGKEAQVVKALVEEAEKLIAEMGDLDDINILAKSGPQLVSIRETLIDLGDKANLNWEKVAEKAGATDKTIKLLRNAKVY